MILTDFLASNSYIITNILLIKACGTDAAIILGELCSEYNYWDKTNQLTNGEWFYSTRENIENNTGLSEYKQRMAIKKLIQIKLISTKRMGVPCKVYYKINENEIINLCQISKQEIKNLNNKNLKNLISGNENFEELDIENFNINNNNKNNKNNNKEYNSFYRKKNYNPNFEQREYPPDFFEQFYAN